jgi:hypothetical protein
MELFMSYVKSVRGALAALSFAVIASACGGGVAPPAPEPFDGDLSTVLAITVRNQQLEDARVWLWVDGQRETLGSIRGNREQTFYHRMDGIRSIHMEFRITLGPTCITRDVSLGPGDNVQATIPSLLTGFNGVCR